MARKKTKRYKRASFPRILRFIFILVIACIIIYSYYLSTKGALLKNMVATYHLLIKSIAKRKLLLGGVASYIFIFFLGYIIGKKHN